MIDLEKEYQGFENMWILLGASLNNFKRGENNTYHLVGDNSELNDSEKELTLKVINSSLAMWLIQSKLKQAEINDLKQQLAEVHKSRASWVEYSQKIESGEFVLVPRELPKHIAFKKAQNLWDINVNSVRLSNRDLSEKEIDDLKFKWVTNKVSNIQEDYKTTLDVLEKDHE